ncbi:cysteinyl-tRNA synthetase [Melioribacter roseus P3M-2]|uniref:Cysteine--tRNA ligase n=1 Tax=Melioribacter roseus (strain DSM 23840 / JCM 17771 / VKM B-2668 / P3M-2) TaxID=1191523 RepID=I6Z7Y8_MELRP|nr:cysteine--tRNA ligase [Melioribacter roseus]AFN75280.1 cysteinyl-tRNA synthetase [Melioribacter roseus P3M-2]
MKIYNTFSKTKEEFIPLNPPNVTFYVCGPTVYDYFHIGNARSFVMADIARKYLEFNGFVVKFIMNITDIDDKIIKKSFEEKKSTREIADFFAAAFKEDLERLYVKPATLHPRATEHIDDIVRMINRLVDKGYAYEVDGTVFYDISKFKEYGKLSGKNLEELEAGSRIEINEKKRNPLDFVLWKKAKEGEPAWVSPWGKGRPGWHIECSAMSCKHLGETIDIHAGGNDLIFPHHENEIAQSEAANGKKFVRYWMHFGFLNFQNEKMSKSLGNFFTTREILSKYTTEAIRLFFSQTHYRGPLNFSEDLLSSAEKGAEKIRNFALRINEELSKDLQEGEYPDFSIKSFYDEFTNVMDDDLNTPQAVAVIFNFIREVNKVLDGGAKVNSKFLEDVKKFMTDTAQNVLGIVNFEKLEGNKKEALDDKLIELLIDIRQTLKKEKNYQLADLIRDRLNELGIVLQDKKEGTSYIRK